MKTITLPNQLTVSALNKSEARVLYYEIFTSGTYLKHGLQLRKDACIFDIGANIGLFSLYVGGLCPDLKLFAFEPVPEIFTVLKKNISAHLADKNVHLYKSGLSDKSRSAIFRYHPHLSMTAGMYTTDLENGNQKNIPIYRWLQALFADFSKSDERFRKYADFLIKGLQRKLTRIWLLPLLVVPVMAYLIYLRMTIKEAACQVQQLSSVINSCGITQIDLCKIDVEGSEWDVLKGIELEHWPLFKQLIIEVHDLDDRVKKIQKLLEQNGFEVIIDQEDWALHTFMNIYTIYAKRKIHTLI